MSEKTFEKPNELREGFHYYANYITALAGGKYYRFSVGVKQSDETYQNYNVFVPADVGFLEENNRFKLTKILGVSQYTSPNTGNVTVNVTAEIESGEDFENAPVESDEPVLDITSDDLPF